MRRTQATIIIHQSLCATTILNQELSVNLRQAAESYMKTISLKQQTISPTTIRKYTRNSDSTNNPAN